MDVPERGQIIRIVCLELARCASHLVWLGTHAIDMGAMSVLLYAFRERERILGMFEMLSGQRMMSSYIRPGGVWRDVPDDFLPTIKQFLNDFPYKVDDYEALLTKNPIWKDRAQGVGVIEPDVALAYGMTGPALRGSGVNWDLRKAQPYSGYETFDFSVPLGEHGDVYDRYLIRIREFRESMKILNQAVARLETVQGPYRSENRKYCPPLRSELGQSMESVIHHFMLWTYGYDAPDDEIYNAIESPRGEIGCYIHGTGANKPRRVHFKTPSFIHISALPVDVKRLPAWRIWWRSSGALISCWAIVIVRSPSDNGLGGNIEVDDKRMDSRCIEGNPFAKESCAWQSSVIPKYAERISHHLAKYETKRSAVMPLLYIAQEEYGWVNQDGIERGRSDPQP